MKNLFKFGFFALAISLSVVACNSNKTTDESADSTTMSDSTMMDTTMMDSTMMDTTMMDTTSKM